MGSILGIIGKVWSFVQNKFVSIRKLLSGSTSIDNSNTNTVNNKVKIDASPTASANVEQHQHLHIEGAGSVSIQLGPSVTRPIAADEILQSDTGSDDSSIGSSLDRLSSRFPAPESPEQLTPHFPAPTSSRVQYVPTDQSEPPSTWIRLRLTPAGWSCSTDEVTSDDGWWLVAAADSQSHVVIVLASRWIAPGVMNIRGWLAEGITYYSNRWTQAKWKSVLDLALDAMNDSPEQFDELSGGVRANDVTAERLISWLR